MAGDERASIPGEMCTTARALGVLRRADLDVEADSSAGRGRARKMRVLQFAYGTSLYGAERWLLTLIKHLDPARVETVVGCIWDADSPDRPLIDEAGRLGFRTIVLDGTTRLIASSTLALREAIRTHGIDLVHSHGTRQDIISLLATRLPGCPTPILSTPHGWEARASFKARLYDVLNKAALPFFDAVAPLSP